MLNLSSEAKEMGWTGYRMSDKERRDPEHLKRAGLAELGLGSSRVLAAEIVRGEYNPWVIYAAVSSAVEPGRAVGLVILVEQMGADTCFKPMDEFMGPAESHCPASVLGLLSPIPAPGTAVLLSDEPGFSWAREWRERCRRNAA